MTVRSISAVEFSQLSEAITQSWAHMEFRDQYGTERELPRFAEWQRTGIDDGSWLANWCRTVERLSAAGRSLRRLKVVSTPMSEYHRWVYGNVGKIVAAGEDHRWCARREVSTVPLPGNDFYVLDDSAVLFLHFDAVGRPNEFTHTTDPEVVALCRSAFEAVWRIATPHDEFRPI